MVSIQSKITPHIAERLQSEKVIWLTTVNKECIPQPTPVWFYWDGTAFTIYTRPRSFKILNIYENPHVTLNFEGADELGGDVVIFTGTAFPKGQQSELAPEYLEKYASSIEQWGTSVEEYSREYGEKIVVVPYKLRIVE
ncbi:MAG: pyridoxamine 5'-phosphate oxidase family protein [Anaerolineaceae bacterium]